MRGWRVAATVLAVAMPVTLAKAEDGPVFGPIKLGMTIAEVRAALPNVAWDKPLSGEDPNDPTVLRAKKAPIGDEAFDVNYVDASWGSFSLGLTGTTSDSGASCRARTLKFFTAIESDNGPLVPNPPKTESKSREETIPFGKSSQAHLRTLALATGDEAFGISAEREVGHIQIHAGGSYAPGPKQADGKGSCMLAVSMSIEPPRPAPGDLPFDALTVVRDVSIGVKHHTLDLVDAPQDTTINVPCTFQKYGALTCKDPDGLDRASRKLVPAARQRVNHMRFARRTKSGGWTPYQRTVIPIRISPADRVAITTTVDATKQELLVKTVDLQNQPRFPKNALDDKVSAVVDMGCTVQNDGSLVCSEFKVTPSTEHDAMFRAEAVKVLLGFRFAPTLKDGTPSVGVGYRSTVEFKVD
jgi:hypothetical protein